MPFPFVSRERFNELKAEHAALLKEYHALLASQPAAKAARTTQPKPQPPRDPLVDKLTADFEAELGDKVKARAEAERIKREAFGG